MTIAASRSAATCIFRASLGSWLGGSSSTRGQFLAHALLVVAIRLRVRRLLRQLCEGLQSLDHAPRGAPHGAPSTVSAKCWLVLGAMVADGGLRIAYATTSVSTE